MKPKDVALRLLPGPSSLRTKKDGGGEGEEREEGRFRENVVLNGVGVPTSEEE